ncbi:MAG: NFACT RNA binding domain-containing protein [Planctomycetota bacterium]
MSLAEELELCCRVLEPLLTGRELSGAGILGAGHDLCLFLRDSPHPRLRALRVATGRDRARLGLESVREPRASWIEGAGQRLLEDQLAGASLLGLTRFPGERRIEIRWEAPGHGLRLVIAEFFGPQGNWFLLDASGRILTLAQRLGGRRRAQVPGTLYEAPPVAAARPGPLPEPPADGLKWLERRAATFQSLDLELRLGRLTRELERHITREQRGLERRLGGLEERQRAEAGADELEREGKLLLSVPELGRRGLENIEVADWYSDGKARTIRLAREQSLRANAEKRFARARRLRAGRQHTEEQLSLVGARLGSLAELRDRVEAAKSVVAGPETIAELQAIKDSLSAGPQRLDQEPRKDRKPYMSFRSKEGLLIYVGRSKADNDRLTLRVARGNDIWMHVGRGYSGSHVVIRLDRGKTASLESLLDGATLALHFSKARGHSRGEVRYTQAKYVRKPKKAKPGSVEVIRSKTLDLRFEPERLERLLRERV